MRSIRSVLLVAVVCSCCEGFAQDCPLSGCNFTGPITAPAVNTVYVADNYPGADIGAQINNAVAACSTAGIVCTIQVNKSGTISTPPVLPAGFSLSFNPTGIYTLDTNWVINHAGVSIYFNGAHFYYTEDNNGVAIYVGKGIASSVDITTPSSQCGGTTLISYVSGSQFSAIDVGDTVVLNPPGGIVAGNVASVSATSLCLSTTVGSSASSVPMAAILSGSLGLNTYGGATVTLRDLSINGQTSSTSDTALELELTTNVRVDNFVAYNFAGGTCAKLLGALASNFSALGCDENENGLFLGNNSTGGFVYSGSNSNRFYGVDLSSSNPNNQTAEAVGIALYDKAGSGNLFSGLHVEGNNNNNVIYDQAGQNHYQFTDYERNGTGAGYEITIGASYDKLEGPAQMQTFEPYLMGVSGGTDNVIENLQFNASTSGAIALNCINSCDVDFENNTVLAGIVSGLPRSGVATLASGTTTIDSAAACVPSALCQYVLGNCGKNSGSSVGTLSVGAVTAGSSFVIHSLSVTGAVLTGDSSTVCWKVN
jgi:hypothetical protein